MPGNLPQVCTGAENARRLSHCVCEKLAMRGAYRPDGFGEIERSSLYGTVPPLYLRSGTEQPLSAPIRAGGRRRWLSLKVMPKRDGVPCR
jgi:hypothetical protein